MLEYPAAARQEVARWRFGGTGTGQRARSSSGTCTEGGLAHALSTKAGEHGQWAFVKIRKGACKYSIEISSK